MAPVIREMKTESSRFKVIICVTAQHREMLDQVLELFGIEPDYDLDLMTKGQTLHNLTASVLLGVTEVLEKENPDLVFVQGDTTTTFAAAQAAFYLKIPIAHVEAGLRSFNREMPEEHNRVLTDHCADILFCPTQNAVDNLQAEGITNISSPANQLKSSSAQELPRTVALVGDTMYDAVLQFSEIARRQSTILDDLGIKSKEYLLATVHRPYNTDVPKNLQNILTAFIEINEPIIFPVHPRTRKRLADLKTTSVSSAYSVRDSKLRCIPPVGYLDMLILEQNAKAILTDSGGMQKEAYWFGVPCITLRDETEWVETVDAGWNVVAGADYEKIVEAANSIKPSAQRPELYGDGRAAKRIVRILSCK